MPALCLRLPCPTVRLFSLVPFLMLCPCLPGSLNPPGLQVGCTLSQDFLKRLLQLCITGSLRSTVGRADRSHSCTSPISLSYNGEMLHPHLVSISIWCSGLSAALMQCNASAQILCLIVLPVERKRAECEWVDGLMGWSVLCLATCLLLQEPSMSSSLTILEASSAGHDHHCSAKATWSLSPCYSHR